MNANLVGHKLRYQIYLLNLIDYATCNSKSMAKLSLAIIVPKKF